MSRDLSHNLKRFDGDHKLSRYWYVYNSWDSGYRAILADGNIVEDQAEDVMLDEEGVSAGFEDEILHEGLGWVLISSELPHHVDQDAAVEHRVTVNRGDNVGDALKGEAVYFLHDLGSPLNLL